MGRSRKIQSVAKLRELWEAYKCECDNQVALRHEFSQKKGEFVSAELGRSVTYTIEGFCLFLDISRQTFYNHYANNDQYIDMVTRIREECEVDARKKFELELIPTNIAGLWMSRYGYGAKPDDTKESDACEDWIEAAAETDGADGD